MKGHRVANHSRTSNDNLKQEEQWNVTLLRHSLATLEGEKDFIFFYNALLSSEGSPLSLSPSLLSLFLFSLGRCVHACRPEGLPEGLQFSMLIIIF